MRRNTGAGGFLHMALSKLYCIMISSQGSSVLSMMRRATWWTRPVLMYHVSCGLLLTGTGSAFVAPRAAASMASSQPSILAFFGKPTQAAAGSKRPLVASTGTPGDTDATRVPTTSLGATDNRRMADSDAVPATAAKKAKVNADPEPAAAPTSSEGSSGNILSGVPEAFRDHPVLRGVDRDIGEGWRRIIGREATKPYFAKLLTFLSQEIASKQTIYPPAPLVFNALRLCPWDDVRVVILGQDPYHGPNQAHGLAFSVLPPTPPPPSLMNMFKEAMTDVGITKPTHGNLEHWSRQGVLLLNTVLTVRRGQAHSHKGKGWETFTDTVIQELNKQKSGLVFLLWGKPAQEKGRSINLAKHHVIMCNHPSPLSATKGPVPFIGSKCFSKANAALEKLGKEPIDWSIRRE